MLYQTKALIYSNNYVTLNELDYFHFKLIAQGSDPLWLEKALPAALTDRWASI